MTNKLLLIFPRGCAFELQGARSSRGAAGRRWRARGSEAAAGVGGQRGAPAGVLCGAGVLRVGIGEGAEGRFAANLSAGSEMSAELPAGQSPGKRKRSVSSPENFAVREKRKRCRTLANIRRVLSEVPFNSDSNTTYPKSPFLFFLCYALKSLTLVRQLHTS